MQGNGTDTGGGEGSWTDSTTLVPLITGLAGLVGSLLTFAYVKFKQQFSDEQTTDIVLSTKVGNDGSRETKIEINLKNDERYSEQYSAISNGKQTIGTGLDGDLSSIVIDTQHDIAATTAASNKGGIRKTMQEGIHSVLTNNNKGDQIIGETRNHVTRDGFNTFLKVQQLDAMIQSGQGDSPLQIGSLHSHRPEERTVNNLSYLPSAGSITSKKKKGDPNKLKVSSTTLQDDDVVVKTTSTQQKKVVMVPQNNKTLSYNTKQLQPIEDGDETTESLGMQVVSQSIALPKSLNLDTDKRSLKSKKEKNKAPDLSARDEQEDAFPTHTPNNLTLKVPSILAYKSSEGSYPNTAQTKRGEDKDDRGDVKDLEAGLNHDNQIGDVGVLGATNDTTGLNINDSL